MKRLLPILFFSLFTLSCKHHSKFWTDEYYRGAYPGIYEANSKYLKNKDQLKKLTDFEIKRLKAELPDGLRSVSADSLKRLFTKIAEEYEKAYPDHTLQAVIPWSSEGEETIKRKILRGDFIKKIDQKFRGKFCDCFVAELKHIYPDSIITPVPDSISNKAVNDCKTVVNAKTN